MYLQLKMAMDKIVHFKEQTLSKFSGHFTLFHFLVSLTAVNSPASVHGHVKLGYLSTLFFIFAALQTLLLDTLEICPVVCGDL